MSRRIDLTCGHPNCGFKGTYELPVRCDNCGLVGIGVYTRGHTATCDRCPNCDTRSMRPSARASVGSQP